MHFLARFGALILALAVLPSAAEAGRERALELYEEGTISYKARRFDDAIQKYRAAYQEYPAPEFLFNIAQAYRQLDDCPRALHYYRRYLSLRPGAKEKREIEARIRDLARRCSEHRERPPESEKTKTSTTAESEKTGKSESKSEAI